MSSRLAGKGACACSSDQVTNIRLRPSSREEHRGGVVDEQFLLREGDSVMMRKIAIFGVGIVAAMMAFGSLIDERAKNLRPDTLGRAEAALKNKLGHPSVREVHYFHGSNVVCGQVKHDASEWGFTPFAFSDKLGLTVSDIWGRNATENINKRYGCHFLTLANSDKWTSLFWGGESTDFYIREPYYLAK